MTKYYVVTTANNDFFVSSAVYDRLILVEGFPEAHLYDDFEDAKILADRYGLNVHDVNFSQRFDCGVWKA